MFSLPRVMAPQDGLNLATLSGSRPAVSLLLAPLCSACPDAPPAVIYGHSRLAVPSTLVLCPPGSSTPGTVVPPFNPTRLIFPAASPISLHSPPRSHVQKGPYRLLPQTYPSLVTLWSSQVPKLETWALLWTPPCPSALPEPCCFCPNTSLKP